MSGQSRFEYLLIHIHTHSVVPPRAYYVRQVGARVEEEVVAPLFVADVE